MERSVALPEYPGTPEHQRLLAGIAAYSAADPRILAASVFGSMGRGTWDEHSDLDLDVVTVDGLTLDVPQEVTTLCRALGEEPAVVVPDRADAADVVLPSLMMLSIRYHPLSTTSPNIVDSLLVLTGKISPEAIVAAGLANRRPPSPSAEELVSRCVRLAAVVDVCLRRERFWVGYQVLNEARGLLVQLFAQSQGAVRAYHALNDGVGDPRLHEQFGKTVPAFSVQSLQEAHVALLDLLEHELPALSNGTSHLTPAQREVVRRLRSSST